MSLQRRYTSILAATTSDVATRKVDFYTGISYLVVPVVAMVGNSVVWPVTSDVREYVPASVLSVAAEQWNGRPVCYNHPYVNGKYVSANSPDVLKQFSYGLIFNSYFDVSDLKLKMEAWLDPIRAEEIGATEIITKIQSGEIVEISIGAWITYDEISGTCNGLDYSLVWVACASDHLATLPNGLTGACSIEAGCGMLRVMSSRPDSVASSVADSRLGGLRLSRSAEGATPSPGRIICDDASMSSLSLSQARTPVYTGTETGSWTAPTFSDYIKYLHPGSDGPKSVSQCSSELKRSIANHSLLGDPNAGNIRDLAMFPVVNPSNGRLNEKALRSVLGSRGDAAGIDEKALNSARDMATRLLNSEFGTDVETLQERSNEEALMSDKKKAGKSESLFSRILKSLSSIPETIRNNIGNNLLRDRLATALREVEPGLYWVDDEDVEAGTVRYVTRVVYGDIYSWDDSETHVWQRTFSLDANGNVTLNDDAIEMVFAGPKYVPKTDAETVVDEPTVVASESHTCICRLSQSQQESSTTPTQTQEEIDMASKEMQQKFLQVLEKIDDGTVSKVLEALEGKPAGTPPTTTTSPVTTAADPAPVKTREQWLAEAPDKEVRDLIASYEQKEKEHRADLVGRLKVASKFSEGALNGMDTSTLETLAESLNLNMATVADFSGRVGAGSGVVSANQTTTRPLPDTWGLNKKAATG